ncbi:MAG: 2-oxoglutarate and iron-dependent oxygenase domain-containing protein, partial [Myxococcota bacterium]
MERSIPHLNLQAYTSGDPKQRHDFVQTLGKGLQEFGFLTVEGHGIAPKLFERTYQAFEALFALEEQVKNTYTGIQGGARG